MSSNLHNEQEECKTSQLNQEESVNKEESSQIKNEGHINELWRYNQVNWPEQLKKLTFKTKYIQIDQNFYEFLEEDGIYIHPRYQKNSSESYLLEKNKEIPVQEPKKEQQDNKNNDESFDEDNYDLNFRLFSSEFEKQIKEAFEEFQDIFVKLNQRAPRDTENWLHGMQINNLEDMLTALKSSGILAELLEDYKEQVGLSSTIHIDNQFEQIQQQIGSKKGLYLILKKWYNLPKHMMVRCFIRNKKLIAISQRHCSSVNRTIEEFDTLFSKNISNFFYNKVAPYFEQDNYVLDLYIDIAPSYKVRLIDINPWRNHTNPLLLEWDQLEKIDTNEYGQDKKLFIQYVRTESDVIIEDLSAYRVPEEMLFEGENAEQEMAKVFDYLNLHNKDLYQ